MIKLQKKISKFARKMGKTCHFKDMLFYGAPIFGAPAVSDSP